MSILLTTNKINVETIDTHVQGEGVERWSTCEMDIDHTVQLPQIDAPTVGIHWRIGELGDEIAIGGQNNEYEQYERE